MAISLVIPTFNESVNVRELVRRINLALPASGSEILFIDDSNDDTMSQIQLAADESEITVRAIHREEAIGGLGGAVVLGLGEARNDICVVMDGDLQHPPETIAELIACHRNGAADVVVASRYVAGGNSEGLAGSTRTAVSKLSTVLTKSMFPKRLAECSDPMTGFFLIDRSKIKLDSLKPQGFKILLEILARHNLKIIEVPFCFAPRGGGDSKATMKQGWRFLKQLIQLRFGKMSLFAVIGALGTVINLAIMWALTSFGVDYIIAAIIAAETTILGNFLLQERFVFADMRDEASGVWSRFAKSFAFNNAEAVVRIWVMALMVESWHISSVLATAITLAAAFVVRYVFHSLVVYAPKKTVKLDNSVIAAVILAEDQSKPTS